MNVNAESHFSQVPQATIQRSTFDRSSSYMSSANVGQLIPFYVDEVLPGDTFDITTSKVVRLQTMLTPIYGNLYLDTYWFYVPNRLVWDHWKEFCGENTSSAWVPSTTYSIPTISAPSQGWSSGTLADYFGIPINKMFQAPIQPDALSISALPFRGYALICNEFFRDQNLSDPINIYKGDANTVGSNGSDYIQDVPKGGKPFVVAKYHDYFTSCLPSPQKSLDPVTLGFSDVPVIPKLNERVDPDKLGTASTLIRYTGSTTTVPLSWTDGHIARNASANTLYGVPNIGSGYGFVQLANLYATTSDLGLTVNDLRIAFQLQKYYERLARGGSRYVEWLHSMFGVIAPDASLQRPEYLGGNRVPLAIHQVTNQSQSSQDFLGDLGAMSVTADHHSDFIKSFTEHGYVFGLCCVRYQHSYSQGLERFWMRRDLIDFYNPVFANIGEQPVYKAELWNNTTSPFSKSQIFGYQEAWADYRYKPDKVTGEMRPGISNTLASWHLGDYYTSEPTLSDSWIREDKNIVDRVLAVSSSVSNQYFFDIYIQNKCTRAMPVYSVPGLIDHN